MKFPLFCWFGAGDNNRKKIKTLPCAREDNQRTCKPLTELCCCFVTKDPDQEMWEQNLARPRPCDREWPMEDVLELCEEVKKWDGDMKSDASTDGHSGLSLSSVSKSSG